MKSNWIPKYLREARLPWMRVVRRDRFVEFFPSAEFETYDAFVGAQGECLKSEPRTRVALLERRGAGDRTRQPERFILKEYFYPLLPRTRTWLRHSKAEHEFRSLLEVAKLGLPAAEPVAFGTRRTLLGFVRACFVITRYVENSLTLRQWTRDERQLGKTEAEVKWSACQATGKIFRTLHQARFFLFTAKPKNILLRRTAGAPEIVLIDLPYASHITRQPFARWAQAFDLAVFLGNLKRDLLEHEKATFYEVYLPDPLGGCVLDVKRRVSLAIRWRINQTPISSMVNALRHTRRKWRTRLQKTTQGFRLGSFLALLDWQRFSEIDDFAAQLTSIERIFPTCF